MAQKHISLTETIHEDNPAIQVDFPSVWRDELFAHFKNSGIGGLPVLESVTLDGDHFDAYLIPESSEYDILDAIAKWLKTQKIEFRYNEEDKKFIIL